MSVLTVETTSTGFKNLFAYCENNPIILNDSTGQAAIVIFGVGFGADLIFDFVGLAISAIDLANNPEDPLANIGFIIDFCEVFVLGCYAGDIFNTGKYAIRAGSGIIADLAVKYGDDAAELVVKNADEVVEVARYTNLDEGLNFAKTAAEHMGDSARYVPVQTLQDAIRYGKTMSDPQGSEALLYYTTMYRNGKMYNLEVVYDAATNTVYHFKYTREAIGDLPAIK